MRGTTRLPKMGASKPNRDAGCLCFAITFSSAALVLLPACGKSTEPPDTSAIVSPAESRERATASPAVSEVDRNVEGARQSLKTGAVDDAAAQLLKAQISAREFSQKEAAAYREALAEAYSRALEAAAKGDPRGKAALELIRAANPR
jgi:hypothetical protein